MAQPGSRSPTRSPRENFKIGSLVWPVYVPSFLLALGQGILIPVLPIFVREEFGATDALVGLAVSARYMGMMSFDVPAGVLVGRFGMRRTMLGGVVLFSIAAVAAGLSPNLLLLFAARLFAGFSYALWSISRHTYIAHAVPMRNRGKALSLFGGVARIAAIAGPVIGGVLALSVNIRAPFFAQAVVGVLTLVLVLFLFRSDRDGAMGRSHNVFPVLRRTVTENRRIFATAGLASIILQFMRAAREIIIPLWGDNIGLNPAEIGYVIGVSAAIDSTMFPLVGYAMDRWGRKYTGVPAFLVLAASLAVLPLTAGYSGLMFVGVLAGVGNGLSSGFVLTLGTDFAPRENTGEFLGVWRFISDGGGAAGPVAIGGLAQALTLGAAATATAGLGVLGALVLITLVRETLVKQPRQAD